MAWLLPRLIAGLLALLVGGALGYVLGSPMHAPALSMLLGGGCAVGVGAPEACEGGVLCANSAVLANSEETRTATLSLVISSPRRIHCGTNSVAVAINPTQVARPRASPIEVNIGLA